MKLTTPIVVSIAAMVIAVIAGVTIMTGSITSDNAKAIIIQGMITSLLTLVGTLIAATKADSALKRVDEVHEDLKNGLIPAKVKEGITDLADDPNVENVTITHPDN